MSAEKELPDCDHEVYQWGEHILTASRRTGLTLDTERWIKEAAVQSEQRIDWHYVAGRVVIKAIGDLAKAEEAVKALKPADVELWKPDEGYIIII